MNSSPRLLVVDDDPGMVRYLRMLLETNSYQVDAASTGREAIARVQRSPYPDLVLLDLVMPPMDGLETLAQLRRIRPTLRVIVVTCEDSARKAVQAMRLGAQEYLTKPFRKEELDAALRACLSTQATPTDSASSIAKDSDDDDAAFFVAASAAMQAIRSKALQVAKISVPVLLLGESGTGKEVIARLIHRHSPRAEGTFIKLNCAALPGELLESELFGFEAGAFTGANHAKPGKFELCDKGTIFLDEIAEMPVNLQAKLLHALQDQEFFRLGGRLPRRVDVRILAATNVNVPQAIASKKFREDLYYRLGVLVLELPPLRVRKQEIPVFLNRFIAYWAEQYACPCLPLSATLLDACGRYSWPGNVRELENFAKRYLILQDEALVISELKNGETKAESECVASNSAVDHSGDLKSLVRDLKGEAEAKAIARALETTNWSRKEAARMLNISYRALLYKIHQYGIDL
jgi:two-component system, NtrC family, response regulator AtoC